LVYYDQLVSVQPTQERFYFERGRCLEEMQATNEALTDYDYALALNPNFAEALFNRANLRFRQGQYGFTIADLDKQQMPNRTMRVEIFTSSQERL
jgi:tetratricopeptide (TPR) repeat protein